MANNMKVLALETHKNTTVVAYSNDSAKISSTNHDGDGSLREIVFQDVNNNGKLDQKDKKIEFYHKSNSPKLASGEKLSDYEDPEAQRLLCRPEQDAFIIANVSEDDINEYGEQTTQLFKEAQRQRKKIQGLEILKTGLDKGVCFRRHLDFFGGEFVGSIGDRCIPTGSPADPSIDHNPVEFRPKFSIKPRKIEDKLHAHDSGNKPINPSTCLAIQIEGVNATQAGISHMYDLFRGTPDPESLNNSNVAGKMTVFSHFDAFLIRSSSMGIFLYNLHRTRRQLQLKDDPKLINVGYYLKLEESFVEVTHVDLKSKRRN